MINPVIKFVGYLNQKSMRSRIILHTLPIFLISLGLSFKIDQSVIRAREIFPWDSRVYFQLSKKLFSSPNFPIAIDYPWGARLLFPFFSGLLTDISTITPLNSALIVNLVAVLVLTIFCSWYWKKIGIESIYSIAGIAILSFSFVGPLRTTMYYPGNGYAFECAISALTYLCIYMIRVKKNNLLLISFLGLYLLALGREFSTYLVVLYLLFTIVNNSLNYLRNRDVQMVSIGRIVDLKLLVASVFSVSGLFSTHALTTDPRGNFPFIRAAFTNGWEHLNIFNAIYPYYYALGPIALLVVLKLTFRIPKQRGATDTSNLLGNFFAVIGIIFSMFVGGDTDRFIWWFFPFFAGIALVVLQELINSKALSRFNLISLIIVSSLWARLFLPAIPPLEFVGERLEAFASVRTDYSPGKFQGFALLQGLRLPLQEFQYQDPLALNILSARKDNQEISLPSSTQVNTISMGIRPPVYEARINEYPIPFSYLHNQYEMFSLHPQHGERKAKIILLIQWLIFQLTITVSILRRNQIRLKRWV